MQGRTKVTVWARQKRGNGQSWSRLATLSPGRRTCFHDGVAAFGAKVYQVVQFLPISGTDRGHLELKDPQADRLEVVPDFLSRGFWVELVS
jgi:hypothetical protein